MTYPIHELFYTFQGEGSAMGLPAFFVRTFGCPVKCTFCDSAGTWHPKWIPKDVVRMTPNAIVQEALKAGSPRVVITGGEPTIYDLEPLTDACQASRLEAHLETSGAFPIQGNFDWIVLSPKRAKEPLQESIEIADEMKFVIEAPEDIRFFLDLVTKKILDDKTYSPIWLHPEWSQRNNKVVLEAIINAVKNGRGVFRAGWQIHKLYQVDALDTRSRPLVPLGGEIEKGY